MYPHQRSFELELNREDKKKMIKETINKRRLIISVLEKYGINYDSVPSFAGL